jgi:biotin carboxylase
MANLGRYLCKFSAMQSPRVAVLYQAIEPPIIDGTRKPMKPGGYQDSGADIAYNLSKCDGIQVLSPISNPDPAKHQGWAFPDNEDGIMSAIDKGATHLWANTILFASHPLQTSSRIGAHPELQVVGQGPLVVEKYDDKDYVNNLLRRVGRYTMPKAWSLRPGVDIRSEMQESSFPVVVKPSRGRGSHGVKVCSNATELAAHVEALQKEGLNAIIVEEFLAGEEATVTVMPPTADRSYWALPIVTRFNHDEGIAPYNGVVAVTANSKVVSKPDDPAYEAVARECEDAARLLGVTAPIRIDVRRFEAGSKFAMFDVNMKPVSRFCQLF